MPAPAKPISELTDADYIRAVAAGYANSFVDAWQEHYHRLRAIADRLEKLDKLQERILKD